MDQVDVSKLIGSKIGAVLERLMNELVPEVKPLIEKAPQLQAVPEEMRSGAVDLAAATNVATLIVSATLALLRAAHFPEEALEQVVTNARRLESEQAKAASS